VSGAMRNGLINRKLHALSSSSLANLIEGARPIEGVRSGFAARNAIGFAGESPVVGIDCYPRSHIRR
jgi:hypothetical protein